MILIQQVKVAVESDSMEILIQKISHICGVGADEISRLKVVKRSIDARKKPEVWIVYALAFSCGKKEPDILKRLQKKKIAASVYAPKEYRIPSATSVLPPVVIGAGPAGLFAAYALAKAGCKPILIERGAPVDERKADVEAFWKEGRLKPDSNVQFGEGGAGTFSDGKLNTVVKDKFGRNHYVLDTFIRHGAPASIAYDAKPHIGTDILMDVVRSMRQEILALGGTVRFHSKVVGFTTSGEVTPSITSVTLETGESIACKQVVLAIGHSARDTFRMLYASKVAMQAKEFAVGFRVEHPQAFINEHQYGTKYMDVLPPSPYKLATTLENGRGVYSFCMCPGGYVVNASSEEGRLAVNGMSYSGRNSKNANSAIIVSVGAGEYSLTDPLGAIAYQRQLEEEAYALGGGRIPQQLLADFRANRPSSAYGSFASENKGGSAFANLRPLFSEDINASFLKGMELFDRKMSGYTRDDAILSGVESRTSSPVRIPRDSGFESNIKGLYPCGEGAGYAGGITSAAMDGLKVAEAIIATLNQE